jgi:hypothetical protein
VSHDDASLSPARPPVSGSVAPWQLFVVERRLLKASAQQLVLLQSALSGATARFGARGDGIRYLCSIFVARQDRLISLFTAENAETVRAVNEAALIPFGSIEAAVELPGPGRP